MAIDALSRWRLLQEITLKNKTGTLTVRSGPNYQHWLLRMGSVTHVQSTSQEESLAHFLRKEQSVSESILKKVETQIDDRHAFGFILVQRGFMTPEAMLDAIYRHRVLLASSLLQSCNQIYWSDHRLEPKLHTIQAPLPLAQTLLRSERSFLELQPAVRSVEECGNRLRIFHPSAAEAWLTEPERKVLEYVKSGCAFETILHDPDLDRLTCYRTIFLLWIAGYLRAQMESPMILPAKVSVSMLERFRSVPPEWIYPFLVGLLLGVLLTPRSEPTTHTVDPKATERLEDVMQKPAWSTPSDPAADQDSK